MVDAEEQATEVGDEIAVVQIAPPSGAGRQKEQSSHFVASAVVQ